MYGTYISAGGLCTFTLAFFLFVLTQFLASSADFFLSYWVESEDRRKSYFLQEGQPFNTTVDPDDLVHIKSERLTEIYIFGGIILSIIVFVIIRSFVYYHFTIRASQRLHDKMFNGIIWATMYFFSTNPSGM